MRRRGRSQAKKKKKAVGQLWFPSRPAGGTEGSRNEFITSQFFNVDNYMMLLQWRSRSTEGLQEKIHSLSRHVGAKLSKKKKDK